MEKKARIELVIEQLEERIAPGVLKGNNGIGNGGDDPPPGHSGSSNSPNADAFNADFIR